MKFKDAINLRNEFIRYSKEHVGSKIRKIEDVYILKNNKSQHTFNLKELATNKDFRFGVFFNEYLKDDCLSNFSFITSYKDKLLEVEVFSHAVLFK